MVSIFEFKCGPRICTPLSRLHEAFSIAIHSILFIRGVGSPTSLQSDVSPRLGIPYFRDPVFNTFVEKNALRMVDITEENIRRNTGQSIRTETVILNLTTNDESKKSNLWGPKTKIFECWEIVFEISIPQASRSLQVKSLPQQSYITQGASNLGKLFSSTFSSLTGRSSTSHPIPPASAHHHHFAQPHSASLPTSSSMIFPSNAMSSSAVGVLSSQLEQDLIITCVESLTTFQQWISSESVSAIDHIPACPFAVNGSTSINSSYYQTPMSSSVFLYNNDPVVNQKRALYDNNSNNNNNTTNNNNGAPNTISRTNSVGGNVISNFKVNRSSSNESIYSVSPHGSGINYQSTYTGAHKGNNLDLSISKDFVFADYPTDTNNYNNSNNNNQLGVNTGLTSSTGGDLMGGIQMLTSSAVRVGSAAIKAVVSSTNNNNSSSANNNNNTNITNNNSGKLLNGWVGLSSSPTASVSVSQRNNSSNLNLPIGADANDATAYSYSGPSDSIDQLPTLGHHGASLVFEGLSVGAVRMLGDGLLRGMNAVVQASSSANFGR